MSPTPTKLAIAIDLDQLRGLMREFLDEVDINSSRTHLEWTFETFLQWLRKRQERMEAMNGSVR